MKTTITILLLFFMACSLPKKKVKSDGSVNKQDWTRPTFPKGSWQDFLQHLPTTNGEVVNYRGEPVANQAKEVAIVNFDVGMKDLQQCADALIRLRAEYLFMADRKQEIAFHITSGDLFMFVDYCKGLRPVIQGKQVKFESLVAPCEPDHVALRRYLDIVYTYAGTISLAKELRPVTELSVGTVISKPGSPGHCCLVCDEAMTSTGEKVYKLVEGYTPAQSIYILRNPSNSDMGAWQTITTNGSIQTASYLFNSYKLGTFDR